MDSSRRYLVWKWQDANLPGHEKKNSKTPASPPPTPAPKKPQVTEPMKRCTSCHLFQPISAWPKKNESRNFSKQDGEDEYMKGCRRCKERAKAQWEKKKAAKQTLKKEARNDEKSATGKTKNGMTLSTMADYGDEDGDDEEDLGGMKREVKTE